MVLHSLARITSTRVVGVLFSDVVQRNDRAPETDVFPDD